MTADVFTMQAMTMRVISLQMTSGTMHTDYSAQGDDSMLSDDAIRAPIRMAASIRAATLGRFQQLLGHEIQSLLLS